MSRANEVSRGTHRFVPSEPAAAGESKGKLRVSNRLLADLPSGWCCYLLLCSDSSFYCGITSNLPPRLRHHASGKGGAYTKGEKPMALVWFERHPDRHGAAKREAQIKKWSHIKKEKLGRGESPFDQVGTRVWVSLDSPPARSG